MEKGKVKSQKPAVMWCVLRSDFTLYLYKKESDKKEEESLPLPWFTVHYGAEELKDDSVVSEKDRCKVTYDPVISVLDRNL